VARFLREFGEAAQRSGYDEIAKEFAVDWLSRDALDERNHPPRVLRSKLEELGQPLPKI